MNLSLLARISRPTDTERDDLFDGEWLGGEAWVAPHGLFNAHDEGERPSRNEDPAADWVPL